jgi:hypothetical protein
LPIKAISIGVFRRRMNITPADYRKHTCSSRLSAGESVRDDLSWLADARENYESDNPVAQLDRAK